MKSNIVDNIKDLPSPAFICEKKLLRNNLELLKRVQEESNVKILLALKDKNEVIMKSANNLPYVKNLLL